MILAAAAAPPFFADVAILLVASTVVAYLCHRIGIMPIVSFLIAGALIGPEALGLVHDEVLIEAAAEVGVILLLFTIGIEFSLDRLARIQRLIFVGGGAQVVATIALVAGVLALFGVGWRAGVFTGFLIALSSTAIVMKLLMDRRQTNTEAGQASLAILIFQDLAIVAMILFIPMLAGEAGSVWSLLAVLGKAVAIILLVLVVARRVMPKILEEVARTCSQEIFLLTVVAICFGTAWITSLAGVSLSLGAFLAGLVISESRFSQMAIGEILPLQILFSAVFFVSVGVLLDVGFMLERPFMILVAIAGVLLVKGLLAGLSVKLLGLSTGTSAFVGLTLAQVGEFSFVLERAGREVGLYPAGLEDGGPQAFIAATVVLMMATPYLNRMGERVQRKGMRLDEEDAASDDGHEGALQGHVLIGGYGSTARVLADTLEAEKIPYVILTLSPGGARSAEERRYNVRRGNYTRRHELTEAGVRTARFFIVADDDAETTHRAVSSARALNPNLRIIAGLTGSETAVSEAASVVSTTSKSTSELAALIVSAYREASTETGNSTTLPPGSYQLTERQRGTSQCAHAAETGVVMPGSTGCEECLQMGATWVHLRICMTCGHVGCCDNSQHRHATKHFRESGHAVIRSFEPGETWAWCYVDELNL